MVKQLAGARAQRGPDRGRQQQRRRDQPDRQPDAAKGRRPLANHVIGLLDRQVALEVLCDERHSLQVGAAFVDRVVVVLGGVLRQVAADQDVDRVMQLHRNLLAGSARSRRDGVRRVPVVHGLVELMRLFLDSCGLTSKTTFLMVPVKANGFRSSYPRSTTPPLSRPMSIPA